MPRTKRRVNSKNEDARLPAQWRPRFWELMDGRLVSVKYIRRMIAELEEDAGADSAQKRLLVERAAFLALRLQSMEIECCEGKPFDAGQHCQAVNTLSGLLTKIGLTKAPKAVGDLETYVDGRWQ